MRITSILFSVFFILGGVACDNQPPLKGQSNSTIVFYGLVLDQDGKPLENTEFSMDIEAIPPNWTFETRGKPHLHSTKTVKSGHDGRFQIEITGHILRFTAVERQGYRHFYDLEIGGSDFDNMAYMLNAWSDPYYRTDREHPAVYVFVKEGLHYITVLPCRGGFDSYGGKEWVQNKPGWPKRPSLDDVVQKQPTTAPNP